MAATGPSTISGPQAPDALERFYKEQFGEFVRIIPEDTLVQKLIPFTSDNAEGASYEYPVATRLAAGISYASADAGAYYLNPGVGTTTKKATFKASQHTLRHSFGLDVAARAMNSKQAFQKYILTHQRDMQIAMSRFIETDCMYGQQPIATIAGLSSNTFTVATAEWASGAWAGLEGVPVTAWQSGFSAIRGTGTISSIDLDTRQVTLTAISGLANGDVLVIGTGDGSNTNAQYHTDNSVGAWKTMIGLHTIATFTSGSLWGIAATASSLWKATVVTANLDRLSFPLIQRARARAMARSATGDAICICSPITWADVLNDQASMRRYSAQQKTMENGAEAIRFHSQSGAIDIVSSTWCREGYAYIIQPSRFKRMGPTDVTFDSGAFGGDGKMFRYLADHNGIEYRAYSYQALFTDRPGGCVAINNIVNSA